MGRSSRKSGDLGERLGAAMEGGVLTDSRTLLVFGGISDEQASRTAAALEVLDESEGAVRIVMSSCGGDVDAGFTIYDAIRMNHNPVQIDCYGVVQSIATLILQAATLRRLSPECRMMVHAGSASLTDLSPGALVQISREIAYLHERYISILADRSGSPLEDVRKICEQETYFSAPEAVAAGLADDVLPVYNPFPMKRGKIVGRPRLRRGRLPR